MDGIKNIAEILKINPADYQAGDEEVRAWEEAERQKRRTEWYRKQVPERYWSESFKTYSTGTDERTKARDTAERFAHDVNCGKFRTLIMLGTCGTGKTHLACGVIRECGGLYRLAPGIVEEIRRAKSFSARETEADILESYGRTSFLVIDEIGRGIAAQEEQYMLYQIINARYNCSKPTVLISNQNKKDFLNYVGMAAADRLTESAQVLEFTGPSYRRELRSTAG